MPGVILFATLSALFIYSSLKGQSITDVLLGEGGEPLDPKGSPKVSGQSAAAVPDDAAAASRASTGSSTTISVTGGARGIVEQAADIGAAAGAGNHVVSDYRPGSTTTTGNVSDHSQNNANRAARDIAHANVNALTGPPAPELDAAVVAIGKAFGRNYGDGKKTIIDTFHYKGYRVQIIWRTPKYGGHMGHVHVGAHKD